MPKVVVVASSVLLPDPPKPFFFHVIGSGNDWCSKYLLFMINQTIFPIGFVNAIHMLALALYLVFIIYCRLSEHRDPYKVLDASGYKSLMCILCFAISIISSAIKASVGRMSILPFITNIAYLQRVASKGSFTLHLIGAPEPAADLACIYQFSAYGFLLVLSNLYTLDGLWIVGALIVVFLDLKVSRLRFCQGETKLREGWKKAPLLDVEDVTVHEFLEKPSDGMFALSYRWEKENRDGFSEENRQLLYEEAHRVGVHKGFVDYLCRWSDGRMATLDVNKSVYSQSEKHYIFADRKKFFSVQLYLRSQFYSIGAFLLSVFILTAIFLSAQEALLYIVFSFLLLAGYNHIKNFIAFNLKQSVLPGMHRVWLRLEYECRRDSNSPSVLFDKDGSFATISFHSGWSAGWYSFLWIMFGLGSPVCELPHPADLSGLESRSWKETISLIDEWTNYQTHNRDQRSLLNSSIMTLHEVPATAMLSADGSTAAEAVATGSLSSAYTVETVDRFIVGGEIVYWWLGRLYKYDGKVAKVTNQMSWTDALKKNDDLLVA